MTKKQIINSFTFLEKLLLYLLPLFLILGPALADITIVSISLLFLVLVIIEKKYYYLFNKFFIFFILWCLFLIFLSLNSNNIFLSLESSLFYFRFGIFSLAVWKMVDEEKNLIKNYAVVFLLIYTLLIFDGYTQFITGKNILGQHYNGIRLTSLFGDELVLGSYLSRLFPILCAFISISFYKSKFFVTILIIYLILIDVLIFLSGERSSFFYIFLSTIIIVLTITQWRKIRFYSFLFSSIIILLITLTNEETKKRMVDHTLSQTNITNMLDGDQAVTLKGLVAFSSTHQNIYHSAIKIFQENIFLGVGPKMFRSECIKEKYYIRGGCQTHPHNTYVQLLAETGILGFLIIVSLFIYLNYLLLVHFFSKFFKKIPYISDYNIFLITALYISLWPLVPTGNFFNNWLNIIYYLPIGFILSSINNSNNKNIL